ncbi:hypothetical protein F5Y19DRAFT_491096 [Xylariaceae sp. FL1651]|nr:hypothetical protein F5Y19DRAFT_491096 [Xylariaceae sp. FL1651]
MADAIGFVGDALGIWSFVSGNFQNSQHHASTYKLRVGENGHGLSDAAGTIDHIKAYNDDGNLIGTGDGAYFTSGGIGTLAAIQADDNTQQAVITEFYASNDGVCIAWITEQSIEEDTKWGWTGDWAYTCGLNYYLSNVYVRDMYSLPSETPPRCMWIDADHSYGIKAAVFAIKWPDFATDPNVSPTGDGKSFCGTSFRAWDSDGGASLLTENGVPARKRQQVKGPRKSQRTNNNLIVSHLRGHNATELCESENSLGPDFVSMEEGVYCNMETHEFIPVCGSWNGHLSGCLELDGDNSAVHVAADSSKKPTAHSKIIEWK